ncbi:hypothetical protein BM221_007736 [Beauveria bassiana]|uniref:Single-strand DNA deaminase toxin A-like C-terminal domain-containing protein n=1 Tax=Beauveria bassiana TaxID=176275 RepID=A0A2N6NHH8_BEABA|nr:hypothetical protein BM221_007736 [Beauveria bassiana]
MWDYSQITFALPSPSRLRLQHVVVEMDQPPTDVESIRRRHESLTAAKAISWDDTRVTVHCPFCNRTHNHGNAPFLRHPDGGFVQDDCGRYTYVQPRPERRNTRVSHCPATEEYVIVFPFEEDERVSGLSFELRQKFGGGLVVITPSRPKRAPRRNYKGRTPLMEAALWGHPVLVKMLLEAGADKNIKDKRGMTAGRLAEESDCNEKERHRRALKYSEDPFTKKKDRTLIRGLLQHPPPTPSLPSVSTADLQDAYFHKSLSAGTISLVLPTKGIEIFRQQKTAAILIRGAPFPLVAAVSGRTGSRGNEFRAPEAGFQMLDEGYWGGAENFAVAEELGFTFSEDRRDGAGRPGGFYASHAEAQLMCFFVKRNYLFWPLEEEEEDERKGVHDDFLQLFLVQPRNKSAKIVVSQTPCFSCAALRDCIWRKLGIEFVIETLPVK